MDHTISDLEAAKLEIITKCVEDGRLDELNKAGFFKTVKQIERSGKVRTHNRIWLGRMLKLAFQGGAPNPNRVAIFQKPNEFKDIRKWEQQNAR